MAERVAQEGGGGARGSCKFIRILEKQAGLHNIRTNVRYLSFTIYRRTGHYLRQRYVLSVSSVLLNCYRTVSGVLLTTSTTALCINYSTVALDISRSQLCLAFNENCFFFVDVQVSRCLSLVRLLGRILSQSLLAQASLTFRNCS